VVKVNIVLWILQILLAVSFVFHSYMIGVQYEQTRTRQGFQWMAAVPSALRKFIAIGELLGGLGLILPALTGIAPWLTPLAAALIALLMLFAASFHLIRREYPNIVLNLLLLGLAAFVAYGRFVIVPLS